MKIAYIASGAGGMYCGTCLHDNALAAALLKLGHQVALIPMYTPLRTDEENVSGPQIFYGGINVYLQQSSAFFRHLPASVGRLLDHPGLLKWISGKSSTVNAKELGPLTISVLQGEEGNQKRELEKLLEWLGGSYRPDLIHLSQSMYCGLAREMKRQLNVPVVCSVQGEDIFLEDLAEPHKSKALEVLRERCKEIDGFLATSRYYKDFMSGYMKVSPDRFHVVPLGLNLNGHGEVAHRIPDQPFVIGYLARICPEKGLHILIDAFLNLAKESDQFRLRIAGYLGGRDVPYWKKLEARIAKEGVADQVEFLGEVTREEKIRFLNEIHILSVPTVYREPKGLFVLEAWANGIPVVLPEHGSFPEMIQSTGGGLLVKPNSAEAVAEGIVRVKNDPALRKQMGEQAQSVVREKYNDLAMAESALAAFSNYVKV